MNTEAFQDKKGSTIGARLRQARENIGLNQQTVADRLCLKVSTVRDIEEDYFNPNLASTFLRGYIRSYARLVHLSEEELVPMMLNQVSKVAPMQSFSLKKIRKKRESYLMGLTWLIFFVLLGLTGIWWWQHYQAQKRDIVIMANQSYAKHKLRGDGVSLEHDDRRVTVRRYLGTSLSSFLTEQPEFVSFCSSSSLSDFIPISISDDVCIDGDKRNALRMNFTADCWVEVIDVMGKKLYSGTRSSGAKLHLIGQTPYQIKIGEPAAVQIYFLGTPVDLSQLIKLNQVARLTVGVQ